MSRRACIPWVIVAALCAPVARAGSLAYIANGGANTVSVLDDDGEVIHTITVGSGPAAVAVNPAGTRAYVSLSSEVVVIDIRTQTILTTIPGIGPAATGLVVSPDGTRVYVGSCLSPFVSTVTVIDAVNNVFLQGVSAEAAQSCLLHLAVNPAGTRVYATDTNNGAVLVLDTSDPDAAFLVNTIAGVPSATGIAVEPGGARIFATSFTGPNGSVSIIDASSDTIVDTVTLGGGAVGVAFSPDGSRAYVAEAGANAVSVLDVEADPVAVVGTVPFAGGPNGVGVSVDGAHVYVASFEFDMVGLIDTATSTVVHTEPVGHVPYAFDCFVAVRNWFLDDGFESGGFTAWDGFDPP